MAYFFPCRFTTSDNIGLVKKNGTVLLVDGLTFNPNVTPIGINGLKSKLTMKIAMRKFFFDQNSITG